MPPSRRRALSIPFFACVAAASAGLATPADDASAEIRRVLDRQADDWNRRDLDAFLEGYWKSPKVVFLSGGERFEGWEAMRDRYRKSYQAPGKEMGKLAFADVEIEPLSDTAAFVRGRYRLTMPDGKTPHGLYTLILRKFPEGWRIVHDHTSAAPEGAKE